MANELTDFIDKARARQLSNEEIKQKLLASGWNEETVAAALGDDLIAPSPPTSQITNDSPNPLTKREENVRLKMFEYNMMFVTLWVVAIAMFWIVNAFLFTSDAAVIKFPLTALLVCLPILLVLFFRIREHEHQDPELKHVSARLKLIQATQTIAFLFVIIHTIFVLYQVLNGSQSLAHQVISWLGTMLIFGGIFVYFWLDTHKASQAR